MNKPLDGARSLELAQAISSKVKSPFDRAYRGALTLTGSVYVQGFLVVWGSSAKPLEHAWLELEDCLVDPSLPRNQHPETLHYFPAQHLTVKQLKAAIEEAKEDYPDDEPLPIYGAAPYAYYGNVMLGGQDYQAAYEAAQAKCQELKRLS